MVFKVLSFLSSSQLFNFIFSSFFFFLFFYFSRSSWKLEAGNW